MDAIGPEQFKKMSVDELMDVVRKSSRIGLTSGQQALDELNYRFALMQSSELSTLDVDVKALGQTSQQMADSVKQLVVSSLTIEKLTKWLVGLTVVLGVLTLALVMDVTVRFTHEYFSPLPQLSAPQRPTRPPG